MIRELHYVTNLLSSYHAKKILQSNPILLHIELVQRLSNIKLKLLTEQ